MFYLLYLLTLMIFIVIFLFIVFVVVGLNMYDESNLRKIENYITKQNCDKYIYTKGSYKALCEDSLVEISNSFTIDIKKDKKEYKYKDIKNIVKNEKDIVINNNNKISFSKVEELNKFYTQLEKKLNK